MDSILTSVKKMLGIETEYEHFDADILMHINSVFSVLTQLGVGPASGFTVTDDKTNWVEFMQDEPKLNLVKSYMFLKVKLLFDPPMSSAVLECYKTQISEYESRLNWAAENDDMEENQNGTLTSAGRRKSAEPLTSQQKTERNKRIARVGVGVATVAAAAYYVHKNPEKIGKVISKFRGVKMKDLSEKTINRGKTYVKSCLKNSVNGVKEGIREGAKEAPKKAAKTVVTGLVLNQTKKYLDSVVGKEESARIFQANDNKKIGKFWKVGPDDKDDDD